jgi:hypothetical protein
MIVALIAATALLAEATPTAAPTTQPATATAAQADKKKAEDPNKLVCHSEAVLGSRMPVKRCATSAQAAAEKANAREELEKVQHH